MPWEPLPEGSPDPKPVREGLDALMQRLSGASVSTIEAVMDSWTDIVGDQLATASAPVKIDSGILTVRVNDAMVSSEIRWLERTIVERVAQLSGGAELTTVRVVVRAARRASPDAT